MIRVLFRKIKKISDSFFEKPSIGAISLLPNNGEVNLVDVGAAGEILPRWKPFSKNLSFLGFEPDKRSRETILNKKLDFKKYEVLPWALSDAEKTVPLHLCRKPTTSSLYEPNIQFLGRFPDAKRFDIMDTTDLDCVTLDSLNLTKIDFLKIDIQGAENDVLKGASHSLNSILGLELEVEFLEIYTGQALFGDVCKELSEKGFEFIDFVDLVRWERKVHNGSGQCIFGDALFLKSPETLMQKELDIDAWSSYVTILVIYRRYDLIEVVLELLPEGMRKEFDAFELAFTKVKSRDIFVKRIFSFINRLFSLLGNERRLKLMQ
jgi:FkbM family methyltransferase